MPTSPHIYVNARQIKYGQYVTNKETHEREWKLYTHTKLKTKDGNPLQMARVYLPNLSKRQKIHGENALSFGVDKSGIDRDARNAYIQVPVCELKELSNVAKDSKGKSKLKVLYFNNTKARFNVYFEAMKYEVDRTNPKWNQFDAPERANISVQELQCCFPTTREEIKKAKSQKVVASEKETMEKQAPTISQKKEKKMDLSRA